MPEYIDVATAASRIGCSRNEIYAMARAKQVTCYRRSDRGKIYFKENELLSEMEMRRRPRLSDDERLERMLAEVPKRDDGKWPGFPVDIEAHKAKLRKAGWI